MANAGARYTNVSSEKWEDDWYLGLVARDRNLFDFFCEGNHGTFAGVFRLDPAIPRLKTGPWRRDDFEKTCSERFAGHVAFYAGNWVFVVNYLKWNGAKDGVLSPNQLTGVTATVSNAPMECRAAFWVRYGDLFACHGKGPDTLGIPSNYPMPIPYQSIPGHSNSVTYVTGGAVRAGQTYFFEKLQNHTGLEKPVFSWGRAGRFLLARVKDGYTAEDFTELTDWFFAERIRGDQSSANWSLFESAFNAGCIAVQKRRKSDANPAA